MNEEMYPNSVEAALAQPGKGMGATEPESKLPGTSVGVEQPDALQEFVRGTAPTGIPQLGGGVLAGQFSKLFDTAQKAVLSSRSRLGFVGAPQQMGAPSEDGLSFLIRSLKGGGAQGQPQTPAAPMEGELAVKPASAGFSGTMAPSPATTMGTIQMVTPQGGGKAYATYGYNGRTVLLGDGVDVNDQAAVNARMAEQNAILDMMDRIYGE